MSWKPIQQTSFADALLIEHAALRELDDVHGLVDWSRLEALLADIHRKARGEQAWPPLMMFKALLLQAWYNLSDPGLEKQLARDLLFRRFVGLGLAESVPDHSTLWRFRALLEKQGLWKRLFDEINAQLSEQGLLIKQGGVSIIDASVIEAQRCRPHKDRHGHNTQDAEAHYNVKTAADGKKKITHGFKAHINAEEDGFVTAIVFTAGNVHDSQVFEALLSGEEAQVYADSAYASKKTSDFLAEQRIENRIIERAYRNKPLTPEQKMRNRRHSGTRCTVERVFGVLKLHYGMAKARYLGLARNATRFGVMCMAYNIKRGVAIAKECVMIAEELRLKNET